jgi:hypothetical protein
MEFMLYIRNAGDAKAALSSEDHLAFVRSCEVHIADLKSRGKLIAAQPILREGMTIRRQGEDWLSLPLDPTGEIQVGYYHIRAVNLEEAMSIARQNPEFQYVPSASIEVRPVKTREEETGFDYPGREKSPLT